MTGAAGGYKKPGVFSVLEWLFLAEFGTFWSFLVRFYVPVFCIAVKSCQPGS
jgi:hypothetical protein